MKTVADVLGRRALYDAGMIVYSVVIQPVSHAGFVPSRSPV